MIDEYNDDPPEFEIPGGDAGDEQPPAPAPELDYDRLATAVAEKMRPAPKETPADPTDPYEGLETLMYDNPKAYHQKITEIATQRAMAELAPRMAPAAMFAHEVLTRGMEEDAKSEFDRTLQEFGADPAAVASNPQLAGLLKDAAIGRAMQKRTPIPGAERVGGGTSDNESVKQELENAYKDWGFKYDDFAKTQGGKR